MKTKYENYLSDENVAVPKKLIYCDTDGFPNELAFRDFCKSLEAGDNYRLVCTSFDLTHTNVSRGYAYGTLVLRKIYTELRDFFYIFRVSGDKFNIIARAEQIDVLINKLNSYPSDYTTVYYGVVDDEPITKHNYETLRKLGKEYMYKYKAYKTKKSISEVNDEAIVGNKGNVPAELQETAVRKYKETLWYAEIEFEETEPSPRKVKAHIFITDFKKFPALLNMVIVMEDERFSKAFCGNLVCVGFNENKFDINARIDDEGKLIVQCFPERTNRGRVSIAVHTYEGDYIPVNFGKRVGNDKEIFPIKPNMDGYYEYVIWDSNKRTAELVDTGLINIDNVIYSVGVDNNGIILSPTGTNI